MNKDMKTWHHFNPVRIVQGAGILERVAEWLPRGPILLVTTKGSTRRGVTARIQNILNQSVIVYDQVTINPDIDLIDETADTLRHEAPKAIIALGGGSAIDTGKGLAVALSVNRPTFLTNLLRHGKGSVPNSCVPLIAVPTTAGTGAEVTPFATIWDHRNHKKLSLTGEPIFPSVALLDPKLLLTLPRQETLYSGLDCVSHAMETIWNRNSTPISKELAVKALSIAVEALPRVVKEPMDLGMRVSMQIAAMFAGLAISQNRTAIAHSISYPLTTHYGVPHGLAVSFTLTSIIQVLRTKGYFSGDSDVDKLVKRVEDTLTSFDLIREMKKYVSLQQVRSKITEMITPERTSNFVWKINQELLSALMINSYRVCSQRTI